jgi:hypothetical protein
MSLTEDVDEEHYTRNPHIATHLFQRTSLAFLGNNSPACYVETRHDL